MIIIITMKPPINNQDTLAVLKIVGIYVFFGSLWIYLSDTILGWLVRDPILMTRISLFKGMLFIVFTATLLFFLIARYIRQSRKAERLLRESESRYRLLAENASDIIFSMDTNLRFTYISPSITRNRGYTVEEAMSQTSAEALTPASLEVAMKAFQEELEIEAGGPKELWRTRTIELEETCKDGSTIWTESTFSPLRDEKNTFTGFQGITRNITDRKQAEETIRKSEERYRTIFENTGNASVLLDEDTTILLANSNYEKLSGYSRQQIEGKMSWAAFVDKEDLQRMRQYHEMRRKEPDSAPESYEFRFINRHEETRYIFLSIAMIPGTKVSVASLMDITERKQAEEENKKLEIQLNQVQKMESIGTLAGGIAHDFNNLLMGILGNVSLMLMHANKSHPFYDRLKNVEEYVQRGSDLTKQLLGFARGGKYEVKPTDLGELVSKSSELFGQTKKEIRIHRKIHEGLLTVEVDRGQMEQVLLNLYVNAWQAMPGGGDLYLSVEDAELDEMDVNPYDIKAGQFVKVTITDTGIGMDEATKTRIFEPFFTTKERSHGTGLGLASAYGIIKNHGGFIQVESEEGRGTSFMIYLPASNKEVEYDYRSEDEFQKGQETVLLIDDEAMILDIGSKMLDSLGYKVITANSGRQGIKSYGQNRDKIDLVILDMIMPDYGGKETFEALHRLDPSVRVLLSSGYSLDGQAKETMQSGCKGFIQKPFTMAELSQKIRRILDEQ